MGLLWQHDTMMPHDTMVLSIYHTSPAAYKHIASKRNKFLVLQHVNTLKKYISYTTPSSGFNKDVIEKIIIDSKLSELQENKKNFSLAFDEMKIQSGETSVCECFHIDLIQTI